MPTGYRRGDIGSYSGGRPEEAGIAWKALNFEYEELGNDHTLVDVARFLGIEPTTWDKVLGEFRKRHGDAKGIWLTRTKGASRLYKEFGPQEQVPFNEKDVVVDLGYDGIYVLDRRRPADLSLLDTGHRTDSGEWVRYSPSEMKRREKQYRKQVQGRIAEHRESAMLKGVR